MFLIINLHISDCRNYNEDTEEEEDSEEEDEEDSEEEESEEEYRDTGHSCECHSESFENW